jgi:hypothetical protein
MTDRGSDTNGRHYNRGENKPPTGRIPEGYKRTVEPGALPEYKSLSDFWNYITDPEADMSAIVPDTSIRNPYEGAEFLGGQTMGKVPQTTGIRDNLTSDSAWFNQQEAMPPPLPVYGDDLIGEVVPEENLGVDAAPDAAVPLALRDPDALRNRTPGAVNQSPEVIAAGDLAGEAVDIPEIGQTVGGTRENPDAAKEALYSALGILSPVAATGTLMGAGALAPAMGTTIGQGAAVAGAGTAGAGGLIEIFRRLMQQYNKRQQPQANSGRGVDPAAAAGTPF